MVFEYNTESSEAYTQQEGGLSAADLFASFETSPATPKQLSNQTSDLVISPLWSSDPKVTAVQADLHGGPMRRAASSTEVARVLPPEVPSRLQPARVQPPEVPSAVQPARVQPPEVPEVRADLRGGDLHKK